MKKFSYIFINLVLVNMSICFAQETIDANSINLFGGGKEFNTASLQLQPIEIIDVEPESLTGGSTNLSGLEAGLPASASGSIEDADLWLNFTFRDADYQPGNVYVYSTLPVPAGMTITVEVISFAPTGSYATPSFSPVVTIANNGARFDSRFIYDFQNGYTGDGMNNGYQLKYTIDNPGMVSLPDGFEIIYEIK